MLNFEIMVDGEEILVKGMMFMCSYFCMVLLMMELMMRVLNVKVAARFMFTRFWFMNYIVVSSVVVILSLVGFFMFFGCVKFCNNVMSVRVLKSVFV